MQVRVQVAIFIVAVLFIFSRLFHTARSLLHVSAAAPSVAVTSLLLILHSGIHCLTMDSYIIAEMLLYRTPWPNGLLNPAVGPEQFRRTLKTHLFACC